MGSMNSSNTTTAPSTESTSVEMDNISKQHQQPTPVAPKQLEENNDEETQGCCPNKGWKYRVVWLTSGLVVLLMSALQHFLHEWLPCPFVALWAPVSESVWEHTKLVYYSTAVWWAVVFAVAHRRWRLAWLPWLLGCTVAVYAANALMVSLFFVVYRGLGLPLSLGLDIFFEAVALYAGIALGHHVHKHCMLRTTVPAAVAVALVFAAPIVAYAIINHHVPQTDLFVNHHDHSDALAGF